jgi:hypothetical protein
MQKVPAFFIVLFLSTNVWFAPQERAQPAAKLVHRYEQACGYSCLQELAISLGGVQATKPDDTIAVRFCSKESLPIALTTAAAAPEYLISILTGSYGYTPERILFLRSVDCPGTDSKVTATEFWVIPKGASLPPSVESIKSNQAQVETISMEAQPVEDARNFKAALNEFTEKLRARPRAFGVVLGYYYRRPTTAIKQRLATVRISLKQSGLSQDRYHARLMPWTGERSLDPPQPEPAYPSFIVVDVTGNLAHP